MIWTMIVCHYHQAKLEAYLDGILSPRVRRRVARHIDTCPNCYRAYARRRELRRELQQELPLIGRDHQPDFNRMWGAIRAELPRPRPRRVQFRYSIALLMMLLALLVPFTMGNHDLARALPQQPVPHAEPATETPERTEEPLIVVTAAVSSTMESSVAQQTAPPTLPEPDENRDSE